MVPSGLSRADRWLIAGLVATLAGLAAALALTVDQGLLFGFSDAPSHVVTPRRAFDNAEPSLSQLGTHWAPLFHALQLPLVWIDPLFRSGASAVAVSIAATLVTSFFLYRLVLLVGGRKSAALVAVLILVANPNVLFAGVIPMLYATIMAAVTANVYFITRWALGGSAWALALAGVALTLATLTHFDTWVLAPLELCVVALVTHRRWHDRRRTEATVILWLLSGGYGIALFLLLNVSIYGSPLAFLQPFAGTGDVFGTAHRGLGALLDYPLAAWLNAGPALVLLAGVGLLLLLARARRHPCHLIPLLLLYPLAWYSFQAATAGSIIEPGDSLGDWRNLRYGITIVPALAFIVAVGYRRAAVLGAACLAIAVGSVLMVTDGQVAAWEDAKHDLPIIDGTVREAGAWLSQHGRQGRVLIPHHHETVDRLQLASGLPLRSFIDGNDTGLLRPAMRSSTAARRLRVRWLVALRGGDEPRLRLPRAAAGASLCWQRNGQADSARESVHIQIFALEGSCPTGPLSKRDDL